MTGDDRAPTAADVAELAAACRGYTAPMLVYPSVHLEVARFHDGRDADAFAARLAAVPTGDVMWRYGGTGRAVLVATWRPAGGVL